MQNSNTEVSGAAAKVEALLAMATSVSVLGPRDRRGWTKRSESMWGPSVSLARLSCNDRNGRFVIARATRRSDGRPGYEVAVLGSGDSWESAFGRAGTSDLGIASAIEYSDVLAMVKKAVSAQSPLEFADGLMHDSLEKAKLAGATEEDLSKMKTKFDEARKMIKDADHNQ